MKEQANSSVAFVCWFRDIEKTSNLIKSTPHFGRSNSKIPSFVFRSWAINPFSFEKNLAGEVGRIVTNSSSRSICPPSSPDLNETLETRNDTPTPAKVQPLSAQGVIMVVADWPLMSLVTMPLSFSLFLTLTCTGKRVSEHVEVWSRHCETGALGSGVANSKKRFGIATTRLTLEEGVLDSCAQDVAVWLWWHEIMRVKGTLLEGTSPWSIICMWCLYICA